MPWIILAVVTWVVGLGAVPQESFRKLVPFSLLAGFGLAMLVNLMGASIFRLWGFTQLSWPILGTPFWVLLAWVPTVIVFVYFLPTSSLPRLAWILLFPTAYTAIDYLFLRAGYRFFSPDWNLAYAFLLSLGIHLLILSFYLVSVRRPEATLSATTSTRERSGGHNPGGVS
jgi:hypothetical protein